MTLLTQYESATLDEFMIALIDEYHLAVVGDADYSPDDILRLRAIVGVLTKLRKGVSADLSSQQKGK